MFLLEEKDDKIEAMKEKIAIAMSGGVDSGVAAALVVKMKHEAAGFHLRLWQEKPSKADESLEAARRTARQLGIPFYLADFQKIFKKRVVDYFLKEYAEGLTPNPCVKCNQLIKFGELMKYAKKLGYYYLATGHYARVKKNDDFCLSKGKDQQKDQSYFLYGLTQKQLSQTLFPVGNYQKSEVIKMARKWKLPVAERPESQEICFFKESDYRPFLKRQIKKRIVPGDVIDTKRKVIGKHHGLPLYTIGQRHGFRITDKKVIGPLYVINKKVKKNQLVVGFGKEVEKKEFTVKEVNWISGKTPRKEIKCQVRIRHQGNLLECRVKGMKVTLDEPERGVAPGQAAVFYQGEKVLGGGLITIDKG